MRTRHPLDHVCPAVRFPRARRGRSRPNPWPRFRSRCIRTPSSSRPRSTAEIRSGCSSTRGGGRSRSSRRRHNAWASSTRAPPGELPRVKVKSLAIGGAVKRNVAFEVFPAEELAPLIGPHDGVLSTDFFKDLVLEIDYPAGVVRFYASSPIPKRAPKEPAARASVPMVFSPRAGALPFTDSVLVDGKPVRALFDTGGSGGFMAMKQLVDRAKLEVLPDTGPKIAVGMLSNGQATQQTRAIRPGRADRARLLRRGVAQGHDCALAARGRRLGP